MKVTPEDRYDIKLGIFSLLAMCMYYDYAKIESYFSAVFFMSLGAFITYLTMQNRTQK